MTIACLVVEDQLPAQRILVRYIANLPHLELVTACGTAFDAMLVLHRQPVDLMFLDLNLPRLGGFDLLRSISHPPRVIVTTAYPEHALEGFELAVVDYLVKPISFERFIRAVDRAGVALAAPNTANAPLMTDNPVERARDDVFVKVHGELRRLALNHILFIRAEGDFVTIVTSEERLFVAGTLGGWETRLPADRFVRTHKSYIVNLAHVSRIKGSIIETTAGGIPVGRSFRQQLLQRLA